MKFKKLSALALSVALMTGCSNSGKSTSQEEIVTEIKEPVEITFLACHEWRLRKVFTKFN